MTQILWIVLHSRCFCSGDRVYSSALLCGRAGLGWRALGAQVGRGEALDQVLLHAAGGGDDAVHHLVLREVADRLAHPAGRHVRGVAQEDGSLNVFPDLGVAQLFGFILTDFFVAENNELASSRTYNM
jgi:hypothetical protein